MRLRTLLAVTVATLCATQSLAAVIYVDNKATGANNGTSWINAYTQIQTAVTAAVAGDEIWVGQGTYNETRPGGAGNGSLELKANVALYGGFKGNVIGTGFETARSQRDPLTNVAIIDGTNGRGIGARAYHVVAGAAGAVLDGFTVSNGNANGPSSGQKRGAGINILNVTMTVSQCIVSNNRADDAAGGIKLVSNSSVIERTAFINNECNSTTAFVGGGAICIENGPGNPTIRNCTFFNNRSQGSVGGGVGGGAITISGAGVSPSIMNCSFFGNTTVTATNAASGFTGTVGGGGAIYVVRGATPVIQNSIFWGDVPSNDEIRAHTMNGAEAVNNAVLPTLTNCIIQGGYAGPGAGNTSTDPQYLTPGLGNLRLQAGSPARDTGLNAGAPSNDYLGTARPLTAGGAAGGTVDKGAFEYDATPPTALCTNQLVALNAAGSATLNLADISAGSSDAGGIKSLSLSQTSVTCANIPSTSVTLTVTDYAGNVATCNASITVLDVTNPNIVSCAANQVLTANASCQAVVPSLTGSVSANDACGIASITQSPLAGATISTTTNVLFTVTDNNGRTANCSAQLTIQDNTNPTITTCAPNQSIVADSNCQAVLPNLTSQVSATDNCGTPVITQSPVAGTVISAPTLVTFTATDGAGRTATCSATVSLQDVTDPVITVCPAPQNLLLNGSCQVAVPNLVALTTATDNCGAPIVTQSPTAGTIINAAGITNVTITATDGGGNIDTCSVQLNVADNTNPVINTCASSTTVNLGPACNAVLPNLTGGVSASDNCGVPTISQSPVAGTIITASTLVTLTATDINNNTATCQATVDVQDIIPPSISICAAPRTISRSGTCDTLVPNLTPEVTASDNCTANPVITQDPLAGTLITGNTTVTLTATDASNNSSTCQAVLTLVDDQNPVITQCALDTTVQLDTNCEAIVPNLTATVGSTDNCAVATTTQSPLAGTTIVADTLVTFTVTDTSGNFAQCSANVTIDDSIPPVITTCAPDQVISLSAQCDAQVPDFTANTIATDNCTVASITQVPAAGTVILTNTVVTITATDAFGNTDTCTANANVVDDTPPVITLNGGAALAYLTGQIYTEQGATASDNCDTNVPVTIGGDVVNTAVVGIYFVTYNAVDDDGNNAIEVVRQVTVTLNTPPVITILGSNPIQVECQAVYVDEGATAFDADQGDITGDMITTSNVNTAVPGDYQVTYEVTDNAFTTVQEVRTVQVRDTTVPVITITGANPLRHECSTPYVDPGATATDICDGVITSSIVTNNPVNENSAPGDYNVTYTVTDAGGNTTIETRVVEVRDATIPILTLNGGSTVQHECGTVYNDLGAFASDTCDGDITVLISVTNPVDANSDVGDYTVLYNVIDASNNAAVQISRTVQVRDTVRPVITLNGAQVVAINITQPYVEQGATAFDQCDGDLTAGIVITGSVNVNLPGSYFINYNVVDSHSNNAVQVIRTVIVQGSNDPPIVIDQPDDLTVNYNATAQFAVVAASPVAITYRWARNGIDLSDNAKFSGTGTATLTIANSANADEANYTCRVTNIFGFANSNPGVLTVLDPAIIEHPQSRSVIAGSTSVFTVVAVGSGTLQYQWFKDGSPIGEGGKFTGTQTASLSITDTQNPEEGDYYVRVTGADGPINSTVANLEVGNPAIVENPVDLTVDPGDTATFTVVVQGTPPILFRWRKNGVNLTNGGRFSGTNQSTLTITGAVEGDEGSYDCVIIGQEIVVCNPATLKVNDPPVLGPIVLNPTSGVYAVGANGTLSAVIVSGTPPFTFQWTKNGSDILTKAVVNGTSQVLNVANAQESDEGSYTCIVTNSAGQATAVPVTLKVGLTIFADLRDETVEDGTIFDWPVGVGGAVGGLIFEWFKEDNSSVLQPISDGGGLTGTGTNVLHFEPIAFADDGFYQVQVSDNSDTVTSRLAKLTVVSELPLAGGLGLAALVGVAALLGAAAARRKK